jgi:hypothetical protein
MSTNWLRDDMSNSSGHFSVHDGREHDRGRLTLGHAWAQQTPVPILYRNI